MNATFQEVYQQPWFHGKLSRMEAEARLKASAEHTEDGNVFLVRESSTVPTQFCLSILCSERYVHTLFKMNSLGDYYVTVESKCAATVSGLVSLLVEQSDLEASFGCGYTFPVSLGVPCFCTSESSLCCPSLPVSPTPESAMEKCTRKLRSTVTAGAILTTLPTSFQNSSSQLSGKEPEPVFSSPRAPEFGLGLLHRRKATKRLSSDPPTAETNRLCSPGSKSQPSTPITKQEHISVNRRFSEPLSVDGKKKPCACAACLFSAGKKGSKPSEFLVFVHDGVVSGNITNETAAMLIKVHEEHQSRKPDTSDLERVPLEKVSAILGWESGHTVSFANQLPWLPSKWDGLASIGARDISTHGEKGGLPKRVMGFSTLMSRVFNRPIIAAGEEIAISQVDLLNELQSVRGKDTLAM
eukprot:comp21160_c0_seq1/m.28662 comp21160_c0_seq1/g.28662  ORF comp21160_c0_seq1/g.28662 comp21160_c0_seq1/m.28662 type:complete len:412 (-) comp21160_c0_seq1:609-1844(-)